MQACSGCGTTTAGAGPFCPVCGAVRDPSGTELAATAPGAPAASASLVGRTIGDFVIDGVIGGGSFGTVYGGRQLGLDRPIAIKIPTYEIAADPVQARRFAREARAAARIVHPGVVAIYAVGELDDGRPYLAMQLIDGAPLDRILEDGPVPALRALRIARDVASALSETHAAGVIHRDLKPSNVMWRRDRNGDDRITLVDFGIAVGQPGGADASRLTAHGLIGTPHYMSPELAQGDQVDARADLYSLGCLLFELTTATTPFDGSGFEVLLAHLGRPVPRASGRHPDVPPAVDRLIEQLMQKRRDDRPASADAVVALLDELITGLADPRSSSRRTARRKTRPSATGVATPAAAAGSIRDAAAPGAAASSASRRLGARRRLAAAALAALALSGAGFAGYRLHGGPGVARMNEPEPSQTAQGPVSATGERLRRIARDDGELIVRALVPDVIRADVPVLTHLEIQTKLGRQFNASQVVVTIADPDGNATGQTAVMHGDEVGHYMFRHTFARPGRHIVRIFPSETEATSTFELDVDP
ncbi:MAG TPA: serine/threonine-protein kinase [Kofleriaceae bacterium]|jgi:serine/threonine-protein kinase|nr:serine/threonine-protein kinase [Kofleriaceae bacterium]